MRVKSCLFLHDIFKCYCWAFNGFIADKQVRMSWHLLAFVGGRCTAPAMAGHKHCRLQTNLHCALHGYCFVRFAIDFRP